MHVHSYKDIEVESAQMAERTLNQHTAFLPIHSLEELESQEISLVNKIDFPKLALMRKCTFYAFAHKKEKEKSFKWRMKWQCSKTGLSFKFIMKGTDKEIFKVGK